MPVTAHIQSVHHVALRADNSKEADLQHFYGDLLGLTDISHPGSRTRRFSLGRQTIDIQLEGRGTSDFAGHVALEVYNLPDLRYRLLQTGLQLDEERPLPGYRRFYVKDPAGNLLEFLEPEPDGSHLP